MLKNTDKKWAVATIIWLLLSIALCIATLLAGCQAPEIEPLLPITPGQALADAIAKTNWVIALSIAGIAFSVMAWVNGSKTAIGVLVGCIVALWLQITVVRYANILAWFGLVAAIGLGVWTVFVKNRALKEVIIGIQDFKDHHPPVKEYLGEQNKTTKKIVSQIKGELPGKKA